MANDDARLFHAAYAVEALDTLAGTAATMAELYRSDPEASQAHGTDVLNEAARLVARTLAGLSLAAAMHAVASRPQTDDAHALATAAALASISAAAEVAMRQSAANLEPGGGADLLTDA